MRRAILLLLLASAASSSAAQSPSEAGMLTTTYTGGYVSVPDSPSLVPATGSMTIEAWVRFLGTPGTSSTALRKNPGTPAYLLRVDHTGVSVELYVNINGSYTVVSAGVPNIIGAWHHLAGTYDGTTIRLFFDGAVIAQSVAPGVLTNQPGELVIAHGANSSEQWAGSIDEIRLWSVARTAAQVASDRFHEVGPMPGLVSVWRMNGGFTDSIGTNHGNAVGTVSLPVSTSPVVGNYLLAPPVAPIGTTTSFTVVTSDVGHPYLFDVTASGSSPGLTLPAPVNVTIPLNPPWLNLDFGYLLPPGLISGFLGFVPPSNQAFPLIHVPADPSLVGLSLTSAFVVLDPSSPTLITRVSAPKTTMIASFAPTVSSVVPATSPVSGGATVTVNGANFQPGATVSFDGAMGSNVLVNGPGSITVTTPSGTLGPADVLVQNPDTLGAVLAGGLTYVPNLLMTAILPQVALAGTTAVVMGSGFVPGLTVTIGAASVIPTNVTPMSISFMVPAGIPCNTSVSVVNPDLQIASLSWNPAPMITQGFNLQGSAGGGGNFFLLGAFTTGTTVTIAGSPATVTGLTPTALLAVAPSGIQGPATVVVSALSGCSATTTYLYQ